MVADKKKILWFKISRPPAHSKVERMITITHSHSPNKSSLIPVKYVNVNMTGAKRSDCD